jgi:hypothetical protein
MLTSWVDSVRGQTFVREKVKDSEMPGPLLHCIPQIVELNPDSYSQKSQSQTTKAVIRI